MHIINMLRITISFIVAISFLAACGGGGGSNPTGGGGACGTGPDCANFTFDGTAVDLVEKPVASGYYDPDISADLLYSVVSGTRTSIDIKIGKRSDSGYYEKTLSIDFADDTTGIYTPTIVYSSLTGTSYESVTNTATLTVTRYDTVFGGRVEGTFEAMMCDWNDLYPPCPENERKRISGKFYATKWDY